MTVLQDVQNFQVNDCVLSWDPVASAESYQLRIGADWETATPLIDVDILSTSYAFSDVLDSEQILIKAFAEFFEESANAATVTTDPAPFINDVQNLEITGDFLNFDLVTDATSYEVRYATGYRSSVLESILLINQIDNAAINVSGLKGARFFIRAIGPCNTKSEGYANLWQPFNTSGECQPADSSTDRGFLFDLENVGTGEPLYLGKNSELIGEILTLISGNSITFEVSTNGLKINAVGVALDDQFDNLVEAKAGDLSQLNYIWIKSEAPNWQGTQAGPTINSTYYFTGINSLPDAGTGDELQFYDSLGNQFKLALSYQESLNKAAAAAALNAANAAQSTANSANSAASAAQSTANTANSAASAAQSTAGSALSAANVAQAAAAQASTDAGNAQTVANTALTSASAANTAAAAANTAAAAAQVDADDAKNWQP